LSAADDLRSRYGATPSSDDVRPERSIRLLRVIALVKFAKAALLLAIGLGALGLLDPDVAAQAQQWATAMAMSSDRQLVQRLVAHGMSLPPNRLEELGIGAFLYAGLFGTEGVGLWMGRRWAEYLTVVATGSFVPLEAVELARRVTAVRAGALVLNLAVVAYLIAHLRHNRRPPASAAS
jgi:uncharacterized membrane protein (DUF2068 family)